MVRGGREGPFSLQKGYIYSEFLDPQMYTLTTVTSHMPSAIEQRRRQLSEADDDHLQLGLVSK